MRWGLQHASLKGNWRGLVWSFGFGRWAVDLGWICGELVKLGIHIWSALGYIY